MSTARVETAALAQAVGAPLGDHLAGVVDRFARALEGYREYQVGLSHGQVALITLGQGPDHLAAIDAQVRELLLPDDAAAVWTSMRRYAAGATWGVKLPVSQSTVLQLYVKQPLPLEEVVFWLGGHGAADGDAARALREVAGLLGKDHTHFLAVDLATGHAPAFAVYFTQYVDDLQAVGARLGAVGAAAGLPPAALHALERYHRLLATPESTVWVSKPVGAGATSVKIDYADVRLGTLALVLEDLGDEAALSRLEALRHAFGVDVADYLGVRFSTDEPPALTAYFTRVRAPAATLGATQALHDRG